MKIEIIATGFVFNALLVGASSAFAQTDTAAVNIKITGGLETVFEWRKDACRKENIPDLPARAFRDSNGLIQLIATSDTNFRIIGPDFDHLRADCRDIMTSHKDPDPSKFDDSEWLSGLYTPDGRTVYALVHNEYHGWEHPGQCTSKTNFDCWYNAVTLAKSTDAGDSYTHLPAPAHLVASIPYRYTINTGPVGVFEPTNIIQNPKDAYYYAIFKTDRKNTPEISRLYPAVPMPAYTISIMRTRDLDDPKSWRAWNGHDFSVTFINPYLQPDLPAQAHMSEPLTQLGRMDLGNITFNTVINRYVLVGSSWLKDPLSGQAVKCFCYSFSDDLIHWSPKQFLMKIETPDSFELGGPLPVAYPSFLDPKSPSRNFETTGSKFYLYYTRMNFDRPRVGTWWLDRDLVRVPVEINKI